VEQKLNPLQRKLQVQKKVDTEAFTSSAREADSLSALADEFGIKPATAAQLLERLFRKKVLSDYSSFVNRNEFNAISSVLEEANTTSLSKISALTNDSYSEEKIRIVRGVLISRMGE